MTCVITLATKHSVDAFKAYYVITFLNKETKDIMVGNKGFA